jgi:hypothetical protein
MKNNEGNNNIAFKDAVDAFPSFKKAVGDIHSLLRQMRNDPALFLKTFPFMRKGANQFMEYQRTETTVKRDPARDRIFPLETVEIQRFRTKHDSAVETAMIHTGPAADELARSLNALAVTVAGDIFFRNGAYRPETEEGRMLLAHEMTHVAQHAEKRITKQTSTQALEAEATGAEAKEAYNTDPLVTVEIDGELFTFRKSVMKKITKDVAGDIEDWVNAQRHTMDEERYLKLLCAYQNWLAEAM